MIEDNVIRGSLNTYKLTRPKNCEINMLSDFGERHENETLAPTALFINETNLPKCPEVEIVFRDGTEIRAILDSGSEVNLLSERVYDKLVKSGVEVPVLPLENVVLVTAFGRRSWKIR
jgi:hypothetical protein